VMQFGNLTLKRCKYGWMLYSGPYIGKCFDLYGQYSESEVSMMRAFLKEGDTVIDVGANIGDLTVPLSHVVGDTGRVYALESHPEIFNCLCANLALNGIRNTKPMNTFVAEGDQVDTRSAVWGQYAYLGTTWQPTFVALDALELTACHLIKVDVDGKELAVLRSGEMQIERFRPVLYFENDVREASAELLSFVMGKLGYDLYWHMAPIYDESNFFGNPINQWAPHNIVSQMVLGLPSEHNISVPTLKRIADPNEWWNAAP
jgi:FkbM family methyltransferase